MHETENSLFSDKPAEKQLGAKGAFTRMSLEDVTAQVGVDQGLPDPLAGKFKLEGDITGVTDPVYAQKGFAIGDRIYHKKHKKEGSVIDLTANGKIIIKLDSGVKGGTSPENLVKI